MHELRDGDLDDNRVRVVSGYGISPGLGRKRDQVERVQRAQPCEIEYRAEINK